MILRILLAFYGFVLIKCENMPLQGKKYKQIIRFNLKALVSKTKKKAPIRNLFSLLLQIVAKLKIYFYSNNYRKSY